MGRILQLTNLQTVFPAHALLIVHLCAMDHLPLFHLSMRYTLDIGESVILLFYLNWNIEFSMDWWTIIELVIIFLQVGAGLPVIASLNRIISSGDPVHQIIGSLSGIYIFHDPIITYFFGFPSCILVRKKKLYFWCCILCYLLLLGTLGYVMSEVEDGKPLSQVVRDAKSLGYTEPG